LLAATVGGGSFVALPARAQEAVRLPSSDADLTGGAPTTLPGLLFRPAGAGPFPAIVLMHGCGGLHLRDGRLAPRHDDWARRFRDRGWVALHVDSFEPRGLREICTARERTVRPSRERARDAYGALRWLQGQAFVRADRVALLGWSNGGSTTLWAVGAGSRARPRDLRHDFRAAVAFYPGCRAVAADRAWTTRIPLQILVGEQDDWTPAAPCVALGERARAGGAPVEVVTYPGAYHDFDAPSTPVRVRTNVATTASGRATVGTDPAARADAITRVPAFLARHLGD
jgi:dienelactone hydrolase